METKQLVTMLQKTFDVKGYIEVTETDNAINMRIEKHLDKQSVNTKNFSIALGNFGNNRNAYSELKIQLKNEITIDLIINLVRELTLYIKDKFISFDECAKSLNLKTQAV